MKGYSTVAWILWNRSTLLFVVLLIFLRGTNLVGQNGSCFEYVHDEHTPRDEDYSFDIAFDRTADGQSFSCMAYMRSSAAKKALEAFRQGFLYGDDTQLLTSIKFPLTISVQETRSFDAKASRVSLGNIAEWNGFRESHFDRLQTALISCANVRNVNLHTGRGGEGFTIGPGFIWFQFTGMAGNKGRDIRVTAINLFPLTEEILIQNCAR